MPHEFVGTINLKVRSGPTCYYTGKNGVNALVSGESCDDCNLLGANIDKAQ